MKLQFGGEVGIRCDDEPAMGVLGWLAFNGVAEHGGHEIARLAPAVFDARGISAEVVGEVRAVERLSFKGPGKSEASGKVGVGDENALKRSEGKHHGAEADAGNGFDAAMSSGAMSDEQDGEEKPDGEPRLWPGMGCPPEKIRNSQRQGRTEWKAEWGDSRGEREGELDRKDNECEEEGGSEEYPTKEIGDHGQDGLPVPKRGDRPLVLILPNHPGEAGGQPHEEEDKKPEAVEVMAAALGDGKSETGGDEGHDASRGNVLNGGEAEPSGPPGPVNGIRLQEATPHEHGEPDNEGPQERSGGEMNRCEVEGRSDIEDDDGPGGDRLIKEAPGKSPHSERGEKSEQGGEEAHAPFGVASEAHADAGGPCDGRAGFPPAVLKAMGSLECGEGLHGRQIHRGQQKHPPNGQKTECCEKEAMALHDDGCETGEDAGGLNRVLRDAVKVPV